MDARRIIIVANQTAPGPHLKEIVAERMSEGPCSFVLLVPAIPPKGTWTFTEDEAEADAHRRLKIALEGLAELGAEVEGRVELAAPFEAVDAFIDSERYTDTPPISEIIVSTLPAGISRWLKQDLVHHLQRHHEIPVTHVIGEPIAAR